MSGFSGNYLAELEPVLAGLSRCHAQAAIDQIEQCKTTGSTGLEILMCTRSTLRSARADVADSGTRASIDEYLARAQQFLEK